MVVSQLAKVVTREEEKNSTQHKRFADQHMNKVCSIRRRADAAEETAAAVERRLQTI